METIHKESIVIGSIVLVVARGYDDRNRDSCVAEHHQELLIVAAVVGVQIVADISVDQQSVYLFLALGHLEVMVDRFVLGDVLLYLRPISQDNQLHFTVGIGNIGQLVLDKILSVRNGGVGSPIPPEDVIVEDFLVVDRVDLAFVNVGLIIVDACRQMEWCDCALDALHA